ncbi:replication initiator protein A [Streptococcus suis]|uniref:replication initiator protein A n=1 Tax=Streptococcus suis TaxID=1307 RepID=UPI00040036E8|nr:replication initiator protein A [Streptococcus suis]
MDYDNEYYYYLPKALLIEEKYRDLSLHAILFYVILLDKREEAIENGWIDDDGEIYFAYKLTEMSEMFGFSRTKIIGIKYQLQIAELATVHKGNRVLHLPDRIYLKEL